MGFVETQLRSSGFKDVNAVFNVLQAQVDEPNKESSSQILSQHVHFNFENLVLRGFLRKLIEPCVSITEQVTSIFMSKSKVLCKFFEFSHDWKDPANNACTFYQKGACSYGSRCRYEHVKVSRSQASAPSSSAVTLQSSASFPAAHSSINAVSGVTLGVGVNGDLSASSRSFLAAIQPAFTDISALPNSLYDSYTQESGTANPSELTMCSFAAAENISLKQDKCWKFHQTNGALNYYSSYRVIDFNSDAGYHRTRWHLIAGRVPGRKPQEIQRFFMVKHQLAPQNGSWNAGEPLNTVQPAASVIVSELLADLLWQCGLCAECELELLQSSVLLSFLSSPIVQDF
ncbi:hypothetical protein POM88_045010 [Heracleum sosnowskyi]|uniref:C3H1-type domain-containing protein n=1 Tax=Heracleum sosnowskyi TaxID=360622 RepID=A0AAD8H693_9APIA|nr:hypothetical protein POM88_045010 [Heracleum sosnowskyi]